MAEDTPYIPPHFLRYKSQADCPQRVRDTIKSILQEKESTTARYKVKPEFITVVNSDRKFVEVSESFCRLLEYRREELIGKPYDDVTAPNTNDIPTVFRLFSEIGYMHGLWMLASRRGTHILVRYESWIRPDSYIEGHMELLGAGY
jgi:PAS domain S-box-containing protein